MARWPEIRVPDNYIAYLRLIPVFCAANWRLKPGSTGEGSGLCATVQLPGHRNSSDDDGVTIETADGEYQAKKAMSAREHG